jgi:hypothetical protein
MNRRTLSALAAALAVVMSAEADALVYRGSSRDGVIGATYTIETDGTIGRLRAANIIGFTVDMQLYGYSTYFTSADSTLEASTLDTEEVMFATPTALHFDFRKNASIAFKHGNDEFCINGDWLENCFIPNTFAFMNLEDQGQLITIDQFWPLDIAQLVEAPAIPAPAPAALALMGPALLGLAAMRLRRR